MVLSYTCDVVCGLVNIWEENIGGEIYHSIPLPYNDSPDGKKFYRASIQELIKKLEKIGGTITEESLNNSLELYAAIRSLVLELYTLRFQGKLPLSAGDFHGCIPEVLHTSPVGLSYPERGAWEKRDTEFPCRRSAYARQKN